MSLLCQSTLVGQLTSFRKEGTTRAVIVGISEYQDKSIGDLRFAHRDAEAFAAYLQSEIGGGLNDEHFRLLTNEDATYGQITAALNWLLESSQAGDKAIIYFSGHGDAVKSGLQEGYILCYDALVRRYKMSGALPLTDLQTDISTLSLEKETQVLFLADVCRSGGIEDRMGVRGLGDDLARQYSNELKLLSCQPHELSHEGEQWGGGRGVFSFYLIEGLMGFADEDGDEVITLMELEQYVKRKVSQDMRPVSQVPIARGEQTKAVAFVNSRLLAEMKQKKSRELSAFKPSMPRSNVYADIFVNADSSALQYYHAFIQAIERKDFLTPEVDCAEKWFTLLIDNPAVRVIHPELRRTYAAALQDDAQQVLNKYLMMNSEALAMMGHLAQKEYSNFPKYLHRACDLISPKDIRYKSLLARAHLFQGIIDYLSLGSQKTNEVIQPIIDSWNTAIQLEPNNPVANYFLMDIHARKKREYDSAKDYYIKTISLDESWILPFAQWGYYLSFIFNKFDESKEVLNRGLELDSTNTYLIKARASVNYYQKDYLGAIPYFERALWYDSLDYHAILDLGACYQNLQQFEKAYDKYAKAITINNEIFKGHFMMGYLCHQMKRYDEALSHYNKALNFEPLSISLHGRLAMLYLDMGTFEGLHKHCEKIKEIDANDYRFGYYMACWYAKENNETLTYEYLEKALNSNPEAINAIKFQPILEMSKVNDSIQNLLSSSNKKSQ